MEIGQLKRDIKANQLLNFYVFTGPELEVQRIYINKIAEVTKRSVQRVEEVSEVYKKQKSLFDAPKLYVVRDDKAFMKAEKSWEDLANTLGKNGLILQLSDEPDKRGKFYKWVTEKGILVNFDYMKDETLKKYILKKIDLSDYWLNVLIQVCEHSYSRILLEIDKMVTYANNKRQTYDGVLSELLNQGAIYIPPQDAIFDWCDSVLQAKSGRAFELLEDCKDIGEPALRLITVLYNNAKKVLMVQSCESKDISKSTGLSAWDIKCTQNKLNKWSNGDLVYMLRLLHNVEKGLKTGQIEESAAMDYVMVKIFQ